VFDQAGVDDEVHALVLAARSDASIVINVATSSGAVNVSR
jgi:hypothetical protein